MDNARNYSFNERKKPSKVGVLTDFLSLVTMKELEEDRTWAKEFSPRPALQVVILR